MPRERIRVLIVDDHPVFRDGLRQCLEARRTLQVVGAVAGGEELWKFLAGRGEPPHVVLLDVEMPGQGGIELAHALHQRYPELRVVMLTAFSDSDRVFAALKAGAVGYLLKNVSPDEIRAAVERAAAGEALLSGELAGRVLREFEREQKEEILKLLATGESNREIGRRLFISEQTVKNHVASIFRKLHVNDRTKAALLAVKLGLGAESPP